MSALGIEKIMEHLPHRYPFLLVDRVESYVANSNLIAVKNVTASENYFEGHFPGQPIMPGVLIIESLAQATGILISLSENNQKKDGVYYLLGINNARFKRMVVPGDVLTLEVTMVRKIRDVYKFSGVACVAGEEVACAEILTTGRNK
tara:strand:- start:282 stop:722 length:441 start_codon:yes stop_codon:yes gene_type:complete